MIAYAFLALGCSGTAAVAYAVAPAGRGLHRYVVPRSRLRAEATAKDAEAEDLVCKLVALAAELNAVTSERNDLKAALDKAGLRIADLEETARKADQLRELNTALQSRLANATAIRPLPAKSAPLARVIPLHQAPFALSPAQPS